MNGKGIVTTLDSLLQWITRLVAVNLLWIGTSLAGLLIAGVFPATAAALGVSRKWLRGDKDFSIWKSFIGIYKKDFLSANVVGWIITIAGIILYVNFQILTGNQGEIPFIIPFAFYPVLFIYFLIVMWSFPLLVHYKAKCFHHIRNAVIIGLSKIHYTLGMGVVLFSITYLSLGYPGMIPFFSISIAAICSMWFALQVFSKIDSKVSLIEEQEGAQ
ncbi:YesL family protein [Sediminibacillus massiliensis]|uniref:YesL family protein n=1 Tax=Sediminibacillus massiliensis TaxID=1926277 RepID=UPI0009883B14|nr:YesL family protein [Sediminibacillus massiliensis]